MLQIYDKVPSLSEVFERIILEAIEKRASDIHIEPMGDCTRVRFRLDGVLRQITTFPKAQHDSILSTIRVLADMDSANEVPKDGWLRCHDAEFVVSVIPGVEGDKAVLRRLKFDDFKPSIDALGMEQGQRGQFRDAIHQSRGLVLLTGPTRSGKNTTIYAALAELNHAERNIATAELVDRGHLPGVHHTTTNDAVGYTFAAAMRSFVRHDVDIAYIREVWDLELAQVMMSAVLQYNMLVFSTLHTTNTAETFIRLLNMGVEPWVLAESIVLVQAQRLLHKLCSECKEEAKVPPEVLVEAGLPNDLATSATVYKRAGCSACYDIGYRGYVMACETMPQRKGLGKELLAPSSEDVKRVSIESGMRTLRMSALAKMCEGLTSLEEVLLVTPPDQD